LSLFSKNLRFLRKQRGLNQEEISRLFHKGANTIGNWENQKSEPNMEELLKLGGYFDISISELLQNDLEKKFLFQQAEKQQLNDLPSEVPPRQAFPQEPSRNNGDLHASPDIFWLILRELRAVNERLDLLHHNVHSGTNKAVADKSSH